MASKDEQTQPLHVLLFPFIAPGHLIPVADMATLLSSRGVRCSILTTPVNAAAIRPAVDRANDASRGTGAPAIQLSTVPFPDVGLPPGVENVTSISSEADQDKFFEALQRLREPFDRFLAEHRPDAVVADSLLVWAADVAAEHGIPRLSFLGTSMFARACHDSLLRNNPFELAPDDPDAVVSLPGLPHRVTLRRSQAMDPRKHQLHWNHHQLVNSADQRSYGEVFNSFAELEPDYVKHYRATLGRRVWLVGPLANAGGKGGTAPRRGDVEAESCLRWLDERPSGSVVYVSFGTVSHFAAAELREVARGLQLSGKSFVWVGSEAGTYASQQETQWMPDGFAELVGLGGRGLIFRTWAPQQLILGHSAIGGFLTHCGWNSVLEAVAAGVPVVTWPRYADQFYNEKLIVEILKMGIGVGAREYASKLDVRREVIRGEKIAEAIEGVMGDTEEARAIQNKAKDLADKARGAIEKGGSSYDDVGKLVAELMARRRSINP